MVDPAPSEQEQIRALQTYMRDHADDFMRQIALLNNFPYSFPEPPPDTFQDVEVTGKWDEKTQRAFAVLNRMSEERRPFTLADEYNNHPEDLIEFGRKKMSEIRANDPAQAKETLDELKRLLSGSGRYALDEGPPYNPRFMLRLEQSVLAFERFRIKNAGELAEAANNTSSLGVRTGLWGEKTEPGIFRTAPDGQWSEDDRKALQIMADTASRQEKSWDLPLWPFDDETDIPSSLIRFGQLMNRVSENRNLSSELKEAAAHSLEYVIGDETLDGQLTDESIAKFQEKLTAAQETLKTLYDKNPETFSLSEEERTNLDLGGETLPVLLEKLKNGPAGTYDQATAKILKATAYLYISGKFGDLSETDSKVLLPAVDLGLALNVADPAMVKTLAMGTVDPATLLSDFKAALPGLDKALTQSTAEAFPAPAANDNATDPAFITGVKTTQEHMLSLFRGDNAATLAAMSGATGDALTNLTNELSTLNAGTSWPEISGALDRLFTPAFDTAYRQSLSGLPATDVAASQNIMEAVREYKQYRDFLHAKDPEASTAIDAAVAAAAGIVPGNPDAGKDGNKSDGKNRQAGQEEQLPAYAQLDAQRQQAIEDVIIRAQDYLETQGYNFSHEGSAVREGKRTGELDGPTALAATQAIRRAYEEYKDLIGDKVIVEGAVFDINEQDQDAAQAFMARKDVSRFMRQLVAHKEDKISSALKAFYLKKAEWDAKHEEWKAQEEELRQRQQKVLQDRGMNPPQAHLDALKHIKDPEDVKNSELYKSVKGDPVKEQAVMDIWKWELLRQNLLKQIPEPQYSDFLTEDEQANIDELKGLAALRDLIGYTAEGRLPDRAARIAPPDNNEPWREMPVDDSFFVPAVYEALQDIRTGRADRVDGGLIGEKYAGRWLSTEQVSVIAAGIMMDQAAQAGVIQELGADQADRATYISRDPVSGETRYYDARGLSAAISEGRFNPQLDGSFESDLRLAFNGLTGYDYDKMNMGVEAARANRLWNAACGSLSDEQALRYAQRMPTGIPRDLDMSPADARAQGYGAIIDEMKQNQSVVSFFELRSMSDSAYSFGDRYQDMRNNRYIPVLQRRLYEKLEAMKMEAADRNPQASAGETVKPEQTGAVQSPRQDEFSQISRPEHPVESSSPREEFALNKPDITGEHSQNQPAENSPRPTLDLDHTA